MKVTKVLRRLWKPLSIVSGIYLGTVVGFAYSQNVSIATSLYWGITTLSTVGYGDVVPTNGVSRVMAAILMLTAIGILGYLVSTVTTIAMEIKEEEMLGTEGTKMRGHTMILGWSSTSKSALQELLLSGEKVAIMTSKQETLAEIRALVANLLNSAKTNKLLKARVTGEDGVFIAYGDPTDHSALLLLNPADSQKAVIAGEDDAGNLIAALILKETSPHIRIVVAISHDQLRSTLHAAGVTYVISPAEMGGRIVSAAATQPEVALSLDDMTTSSRGATINEYEIVEESPMKGLDFHTASGLLLKSTGAILMGVAKPVVGDRSLRFSVKLDPPLSTVVEKGDYIIVTTSLENLSRVASYLRVKEGREPNRARTTS